MNPAHLVTMANQISQFFETQSGHADAVQSVCDHLKKFWEPRMREAIVRHADSGGEGMRDVTREAVACLGADIRPAAAPSP